MQGWIRRVRRWLAEELWSEEPLQPALFGWLRNLVQLSTVIGEGFVKDQLLMRAHSLTYLTLLSIVPLLALMVAAADLIGDSRVILERVLSNFAAVTPQAQEFLLDRVASFKFGALGGVGGAVLIATTVMAVGGVERSLNAIWGIPKQRPWVRRVPDYLAVLIVGPLLMGVALPLRASLESQWVVQKLLELPVLAAAYHAGLGYAPLLLVTLAFSFLYWFLPNTQVRAPSALIGGLVGGLLFGLAQWAYVAFSVGAARYNAVLGVMAGVALFMVWVYFSWAIVLFGAEVAYAHQTLALYRREVQGTPPGPAARESIGLAIAVRCARAFRDGGAPWNAEQLSDGLDVPLRTVRAVIHELEGARILSRSGGGDGPEGFQLGRPAEQIRVADVLEALRGPRETRIGDREVASQVASVLGEVDRCVAKAAASRSLRDMLEALGPAVDRPEAAS